MADFKIGSSGKECLACRKRFQIGEPLFSFVTLTPEGVRGREDRCQTCWESASLPTDGVWWMTRRRQEKGKASVDFDSVQALFFQLVEDQRAEIAGLRYVAVLLLIRKRKLRLIETIFRPEGEMMRLELPKGEGRVYSVPVPNLAEAALESLKVSLKQALTLSE